MLMENPSYIFDLDYPALYAMVESWGEPAYRTDQIWQGLYKNFIASPSGFTNLPKNLVNRLADTFGMPLGEKITFCHLLASDIQHSSDRATRKTLFTLPDKRQIEAVLMQYDRRRTLCISTQSGCAMGCVFCATGQMGFSRNLSRGEIVEQVTFYAQQLKIEGLKVSNIVLMGMGEPFHNYDETMAAIDILNDPKGLGLGARRFTISTVGLIPMIRRFTEEYRQVNLAVSLHAADDETRSKMLPINKRYPLEDLFDACLDYVMKTKRRISFEWALIDHVNDTPEQARKLAKRLAKFRIENSILCHVNAIPLNPTYKYSGRPTNLARARNFKEELERNGIPCTIRVRRGIDIRAGCGQLAGKQDQTQS
jgi:23S rRNA (adenine2503-C2)-methyltransferase